jgi:hypothetical protein
MEDNQSTATNHPNNEVYKKPGLGYKIILYACTYTTLYFIIAISVWSEMRYASYSELKIITDAPSKPTNDGSYLVEATSVRNHPQKYVKHLIVLKNQLNYIHKGQQLKAIIRPVQCSSWFDFFKVFYNHYDYRIEKVFAFTDSKGNYHRVQKFQKKEPMDMFMFWVIVISFFSVFIINAILTAITTPKLDKNADEWTFDVPSWLEWLRVLFLLSLSGFIGSHVYEIINHEMHTSNYWELGGLSVLIIVLIAFAINVIRKRKNYISVSADKLTFYVHGSLQTVLFKDQQYLETKASYDSKDNLTNYTFTFTNNQGTVSFDCESLGMGDSAKRIYEAVVYYAEKGNVIFK